MNIENYIKEIKNLMAMNKFDHAAKIIDMIIVYGTPQWEVYWLKANIEKHYRNIKGVDEACEKVLQLNPGFWFARELPKHMRGYYSQLGQDKIIENFFMKYSTYSKFFIEVGAFDGVHYSNTRRLYETYGWTGICIEPVELNYKKLKKSYSDTNVICIQCAAGSTNDTKEINVSHYPHLTEWGSDVATFDAAEKKRWNLTYNAKWTKETVKIKTLTSILEEHKIQYIDLLSIDAEGHDYEVIKGLDLEIYKPKLIVIEYNKNKDKIIEHLTNNNYSIYLDNNQDLFFRYISRNSYKKPIKSTQCQVRNEISVANPQKNADTKFDNIKELLNPHLIKNNYIPKDKQIVRSIQNPLTLLSAQRFDIPAKLAYANNLKNSIHTQWSKNLYEEHIRSFNNFKEGDGSDKSDANKFIDSFIKTLDDIKKNSFDSNKSLIPVDSNNIPIDGAHRIAACICHEKKIETLQFETNANIYDYKYFINRGLNSKYCDYIALEYCKQLKNTYIAIVFPVAKGKEHEIQTILKKYAEIIYTRQVKLSKKGLINLVRQIYMNESWIGSPKNGFVGAINKAAKCFANESSTRIYVISSNDIDRIRTAKNEIRSLFNIGNHSIHINDTHKETIQIGNILLNDNSIHFLNNAKITNFNKFLTLLSIFKETLEKKKINKEYICIDGSSVMAAYGIREARDIDYLHFGYDDLKFDTPSSLIGSHNSEHSHHMTNIDDIIFNPENYFYYNDLKFASLNVIRSFKINRSEKKDITDVKLIDDFIKSDRKLTLHSKKNIKHKTPKENKIVALIPAKNEESIIEQCIKAISLFTDAIVFLDDASSDETLKIATSLSSHCNIERIIQKKEWDRNEPRDRNSLLNAGRDIGGTHFIVIDADEMLTSNLLIMSNLRNIVLQLKPGDRLALNWIQLWRSTNTYRFDKSIWTWNYKDVIFCDDNRCSYSSEFIHTPRSPLNLTGKSYRLEGYAAGLLHFQFVNWNNLLIKQAWYRCLERIKNPNKPICEINQRYAPSKDEKNINLCLSPNDWFKNYTFFDKKVYDRPDQWRKQQIIDWIKIYGEQFFSELDIWDSISQQI